MQLKIIKDILGNSYISLNDFNDNLKMLNILMLHAKSNIKDFDRMNNNLLIRNGGDFHLTVFNVAECNKNNLLFNLADININDLKMKGIGSISKNNDTTFFIVCQSQTIDKLRLAVGLDLKDLHITIAFSKKDLFHDRKNICNIITIDKLV